MALLAATATDGGLWQTQMTMKLTDQTITSQTVMQNCVGLSLPASTPNGNYVGGLSVFYTSPTTPQIKFGFNTPSAMSNFIWTPNALGSGVTAATAGVVERLATTSSTPTLGGNSTGNAADIFFIAQLGPNTGNIQFQFAQAVSNATGCTVFGGSAMWMARIS
jgi:phenylacetate-coenzyme A ligase PaaK-like adenylate-forming protein